MTAKEAIKQIRETIKKIELAKSEIEWEYPIEYAAAFEKAITALEAEDEREHLLRTAVLAASDMISDDEKYIGFEYADNLKMLETLTHNAQIRYAFTESPAVLKELDALNYALWLLLLLYPRKTKGKSCPSCNRHISNADERPRFCSNCGRMLIWTEGENPK